MRCSTRDLERRLVQLRLVRPLSARVRPISRRTAKITVGTHSAVAVIAVERTFRRIDGNLVMVDAETIPLRIAVGEQACLEHLVRRVANAGNDVGWRESRLFDLG